MDSRTETRDEAKAAISDDIRQDKSWFQSLTGALGEKLNAFKEKVAEPALQAGAGLAIGVPVAASMAAFSFSTASAAHVIGAGAPGVYAALIPGASAGAYLGFKGVSARADEIGGQEADSGPDQGPPPGGSMLFKDEETGEFRKMTVSEDGAEFTTEPVDIDREFGEGRYASLAPS